MYSDEEKALLILSKETSIKKKQEKWQSVDSPTQLYEDLSPADEMIDQMNKRHIKAICITNPLYPQELKELYDPPLVLYCKGDINLLSIYPKLAIVGTRKPTRYGKDVVIKFVRDLCASDVVIVSGLARGIDTCAHRETIANEGKTIAVIANGLDMVYPSENMEITQQIMDNGLVISEYPIGTPPMAFRFPERNRIISGLSNAVLIPEAGLNSGSLITANCAVEQGKELYVVPGSIFAPQSQGCNQKLKELQASIVTEVEDILGAVGVQKKDTDQLAIQLTLEQQRITEILKNSEIHFTEILEKSKLGIGELSAMLTEMEIYGIIRKLPGNYYCLEV